jgi:RHS repeat-associated protein
MYYYDDNGNLFSKTEAGDANNTVVYTWDQRNRLVTVSEPGGDTYYEYNGDGNRVSMTRNGVTTRYINDEARGLVQVLAETDVNGVTQKSYTYGNDLISMETAYSKSYYHYDGLGSVRNLTNSTGAVAASYVYDGFGKLIHSSGVSENNYGFTGEQQFAEENELVFLRARYYSPDIGRFISRDPLLAPMKIGDNFVWALPSLIAEPAFLYPYVYCGNNPINWIDPFGMNKNKGGSSWWWGFWKHPRNWYEWIKEILKEITNVPDPEDLWNLKNDCAGMRDGIYDADKEFQKTWPDEGHLYPVPDKN